jgi:hypothetical protein
MRIIGVISAFLLAACSSNGNGQPESEDLVGSFQVSLSLTSSGQGYTSVVGKVFDGPTPNPVILEEAAKEGDCQLLTPRYPYCEEPCGGTALCVEDDICQPHPNAVSVGTVQVEGLRTTDGETSFSMDPIADNYQPAGSLILEYPAFSEGDEITFGAEGEGTVPAFTLNARGISPLELLNETIELIDGQAVNLSWTPPGQSNIARIRVKMDISHHGGSKGQIKCDTADDGSLELTAGMLDQLKALGIAGFPTIAVWRETAGSAKIPAGRVDLVIDSRIDKEVVIPGLISCEEDTDCPDGMTCQIDQRCG